MAERLSLKELKEQNAQSDTTEVETEEVEQTTDEVTATTEDVNDDAANEESNDDESEGGELVESWMQTEEASSEDDKKGGFKPNHEAARTRKRLKAKLSEKDDELETLRAENERLKTGATTEPAQTQVPARPKREDFDFDDDAYDLAVDEWNDKKLDARISSHQQKASKTQTEESRKQAHDQRVNENLDRHYDRVNKLVGTGKISEDAYNAAETNVRNAMERINKGAGDLVTNNLITTLNSIGDGSEKVMYQLGVNPLKLRELEDKIAADPSGFTAVAFLGALQARISEPTKRRSEAAKPGAKVEGEGGASGKAGAMQKAYDKAGKNGDIQSRISLKRKARAQGVDTTNW